MVLGLHDQATPDSYISSSAMVMMAMMVMMMMMVHFPSSRSPTSPCHSSN